MVWTENIGFISIIIIVVSAIFLIIMILLEKKLTKKVVVKRSDRDLFYQTELQNLDKISSKKTIKELDRIAKNFFIESFKINESTEYTELKKIFKKSKNKLGEQFADKITKLLYSSKEPEQKEIQALTEILTKIISSNHIITKEEQNELNKKNDQKIGFFKKIFSSKKQDKPAENEKNVEISKKNNKKPKEFKKF
jgi:hypothetical protein